MQKLHNRYKNKEVNMKINIENFILIGVEQRNEKKTPFLQ